MALVVPLDPMGGESGEYVVWDLSRTHGFTKGGGPWATRVSPGGPQCPGWAPWVVAAGEEVFWGHLLGCSPAWASWQNDPWGPWPQMDVRPPPLHHHHHAALGDTQKNLSPPPPPGRTWSTAWAGWASCCPCSSKW